MPPSRAASLHAPDPAPRTRRLAELVGELTGCEPDGALGAVLGHDDAGDGLAIVAAAIVEIDQPDVDEGAIGHRDVGGLVHHGSLRRWERSTPLPDESGADVDAILLD